MRGSLAAARPCACLRLETGRQRGIGSTTNSCSGTTPTGVEEFSGLQAVVDGRQFRRWLVIGMAEHLLQSSIRAGVTLLGL